MSKHTPGPWVAVSERLPEQGQLVVLMDDRKYMNTPDGIPDMHMTATGYLNDFGGKYWSCFGFSPSYTIDSFTHWMPLDGTPSHDGIEAQAPRLLEALEGALAEMEWQVEAHECCAGHAFEVIEEARAAIEAAKGNDND